MKGFDTEGNFEEGEEEFYMRYLRTKAHKNFLKLYCSSLGYMTSVYLL